MEIVLIGNEEDTKKLTSIIVASSGISCVQMKFTDILTEKEYHNPSQIFVMAVRNDMFNVASTALTDIKKQNSNAHIILISTDKNFELMSTALELGVNHFWVEPLTQESLIEKLIMEIRNLTQARKAKKILAIGAHPDDVEIGCGGTLLKHNSKEDEIFILTLSRGSQGGNREKRYLEAKAAAEYLEADLSISNLKDTLITDGPKTIHVIEEVIHRIQPDIIYTHSINDNHQDHRHVNLATIVAARQVDQIYAYQSPSATIKFHPQKFEHIDDFMEKKLELITFHETQKEKCKYLGDAIIRANAIYWGRFAMYRLVEPFEIIRS